VISSRYGYHRKNEKKYLCLPALGAGHSQNISSLALPQASAYFVNLPAP